MGRSGGLRCALGGVFALLLATAPGAAASTVVATTGTASATGAAVASTGGPASWQRVWAANFAGRAGRGLGPREWRYQTGTGIFGTGEIETMTASRRNPALDGRGDLDITALERGGTWTSGLSEHSGTAHCGNLTQQN